MAKFWLALFLLFNANNLLSIDAHETDFTECGISDFEPNFEDDSVPSRELGTNHIYKGLPVESANSLPWMVTLKLVEEVICTGTIIGRKHILTAYHCVGEEMSKLIDMVQISYGAVKASNQIHRTKIHSIKFHPNASSAQFSAKIFGHLIEAQITRNDLAIIEVENAIKFTPKVRSICLINPVDLYVAAKEGIVAGWGLTQSSCQKPKPKPSDQLMVGKMQMTKTEKCLEQMQQNDTDTKLPNVWNAPPPFVKNIQALLAEFYIEDLRGKICVLPEPSMAEQGDSGGPLMSKFGTNNWVQVAVASRSNCVTKNLKSIEGRSSKYAPIDCAWIDEATNREVKCIEPIRNVKTK